MNGLLVWGALWGLASVMIGAMADHALAFDAAQVKSFETALRYHMLYAVLVCALSLVEGRSLVRRAGQIFAAGSIVFSGSIYLALITGIHSLTYATPLGGLTIMAAWLTLAAGALRFNK